MTLPLCLHCGHGAGQHDWLDGETGTVCFGADGCECPAYVPGNLPDDRRDLLPAEAYQGILDVGG